MNKKEALIFRVKCIMKKCKEKGKWDLISRLAYKYGIVVAGEIDEEPSYDYSGVDINKLQ